MKKRDSSRQILALTFCLLMMLVAPFAGAQQPDGNGPLVIRVDVSDRATIDDISSWADVWSIEPEDGTLKALVDAAGFRRLTTEGFPVAIDQEQTEKLGRLGVPLKLQAAGIPGYPCYRTVEETYATGCALPELMAALAISLDTAFQRRFDIIPKSPTRRALLIKNSGFTASYSSLSSLASKCVSMQKTHRPPRARSRWA